MLIPVVSPREDRRAFVPDDLLRVKEVDPEQALVVALEKAGLSHEEAVKLDAAEVPAEPVHSEKLRAR